MSVYIHKAKLARFVAGLSLTYTKQKEWLLIWTEHVLWQCQTFILFGSYSAPPWKTHFLFSPKMWAWAAEVCSVAVIQKEG